MGAEPHPPYDRPPLSKQLLAGTWGLDRVVLRDGPKLEAVGAEMLLGRRAVALDVEGRTVSLDDGTTLGFAGLVLAPGAHPRTIGRERGHPGRAHPAHLGGLPVAGPGDR